jgi:hypothetical protein
MVEELIQRADDGDGFTAADADWTLARSGWPDCPEYRSSVLARVGKRYDWKVRSITTWQDYTDQGPQSPGDVEFAIVTGPPQEGVGGPFHQGYDTDGDGVADSEYGDGYLGVSWWNDGTPKLVDGQCYS